MGHKPAARRSRLSAFVLRAALMLWLMLSAGAGAALWWGAAAGQPLLAFVSNRASVRQIYLSDAGKRRILQLTHGSRGSLYPAWGEAQRLAYASYPAPLHLSIFDIPGRSLRQPPPAYEAEYQPAWSYDGRIAAATNPHLDWDIVLYEASGERHPAPFNTPHNELQPCWWPDGRLSFVSNRTGDEEIYVYDFASGALANLTDHPASDYNPACSTGDRLAFTSTRDFRAQVYVTDLRTGRTENVSHSRASDFNPAWLPDGRLSFVSDREGNREIYVLDLDSGDLRNITQHPADDDQPAWSR